jgi:hypothetical protein
MKKITDCPVVGASKRCLILNIDGERVYCSTTNYAYIINNPNERWEVVTRSEFERGASKWIVVYKPTFL